MDFSKVFTKKYPLTQGANPQTVAYALAEYLDLKKNMITQTMRTKSGYTIQCKGDAEAEWTKYIGMDAALSVDLSQSDDILVVDIGFDRWMEKLGIAAIGAIFFQPLMIATGIGALRQMAIPQDIFNFIEKYLGVEEIREEPQVRMQEESGIVCPACGTLNREGAIFCKTCGSELVQEEIRCPNCNELLDGDEIFCPKCGTKIQ